MPTFDKLPFFVNLFSRLIKILQLRRSSELLSLLLHASLTMLEFICNLHAMLQQAQKYVCENNIINIIVQYLPVALY